MRSENEKQKQKQVTKEICECEIIPCTNKEELSMLTKCKCEMIM